MHHALINQFKSVSGAMAKHQKALNLIKLMHSTAL